jgi:hypothetical protein
MDFIERVAPVVDDTIRALANVRFIGTESTGAQGSVVAGPVAADGYNWWQVQWDNGLSGWSVEDFLSKVTVSPPPPPAPTPPPPPPAPSPFSIGARVKTTANLNVRSKPTNAKKNVLCVQPAGALGTIVGGPTVTAGYTWWNVNYDTSCDGWSVQNYLQVQ